MCAHGRIFSRAMGRHHRRTQEQKKLRGGSCVRHGSGCHRFRAIPCDAPAKPRHGVFFTLGQKAGAFDHPGICALHLQRDAQFGRVRHGICHRVGNTTQTADGNAGVGVAYLHGHSHAQPRVLPDAFPVAGFGFPRQRHALELAVHLFSKLGLAHHPLWVVSIYKEKKEAAEGTASVNPMSVKGGEADIGRRTHQRAEIGH